MVWVKSGFGAEVAPSVRSAVLLRTLGFFLFLYYCFFLIEMVWLRMVRLEVDRVVGL